MSFYYGLDYDYDERSNENYLKVKEIIQKYLHDEIVYDD